VPTDLKLQLEVQTTGVIKSVGELKAVQTAIKETASETLKAALIEEAAAEKAAAAANKRAVAARDALDAARDNAKDQARAAREAKEIATAADKAVKTAPPEKQAEAIDFANTARKNAEQAIATSKAAALAADLASRSARDAAKESFNLGAAALEASKKVKGIREEEARAAKIAGESGGGGLKATAAGVAQLAFGFNNVVQAVKSLAAAAGPAYDFLIGSNERLNAQLLESQSNLASAAKISLNGKEVTDPTEKIKASTGAIKAALKQIEIDTQNLVGVTSSQVNELFQVLITNAGALNNQSKEFPDAISAATELTKGFAAGLKTIGVPLVQARSEISAILQGQTDVNSALAKSLGITNPMIEQWRSQGRLVDELNKRMNVFVAGNALAARSIEGISSNINDLAQRLGRVAGEPFLEPIIAALADVEKFLKANEQAITIFFGQLSSAAIEAGTTLAQAFAPLGKSLLEIGEDLGPIALSAIKGLITVLTGVAQVIAPIANLAAQIIGILTEFAASDLGGVIVQAGILTIALTQLTTIVAGLAAAAFPAMFAIAIKVATAMGGLYVGLKGVAAGNLAMATTSPIVVAALKAITGAVLPLAASLLPLAAAIGLIVLVNESAKLKKANEDLEAYSQQYLNTIDSVAALSRELKKLKTARENGTATPEQLAREKQVQASAKIQAEGIQEQIKNLKAQAGLNADQASNRDNTIKGLEAQAKALDKAAGGLKLESLALTDLGTTAELSTKTLENFNRQINNEGDGKKEVFDAALKGKIQFIQSEVNAKRLSVEAGRKELEAVKANTKAELDTRNSANDAIKSIYDGRISKIKELIEVGSLLAAEGLTELEAIRTDPTQEPETRRKAGQQILTIRKEQIAAETAAITAGQAEVATLQAKQAIGEAEADKRTTDLKLQEFAKRAEGQQKAIDLATSPTEKNKLLAEQRQQNAETEKLQADFAERQRKREIEGFDQRRNLLKLQRELGLVSQQTSNSQILLNDKAQIDAQIKQQQDNAGKLGKGDLEGRKAIDSKIAELRIKRKEAEKTFYEQEIQLLTTRADQELKILEASRDQKLISEAEFGKARAQNRTQVADQEIQLQQANLARLGAADIEGRKAIEAKIATLRSGKIAALEQSYQDELEQIKQFQSKANALLEKSEIDRNILVQIAANKQTTRLEAIEQTKLTNQRTSLQSQLKLAQDQEAKLTALASKTRSPAAERAYQQEVQAAKTATARITLNLLENESQQIELTRSRAIAAINDQAAARGRALDRELLGLKTASNAREIATRETAAAADRQIADLSRISSALSLQNELMQARAGLARAIAAAGQLAANTDVERTKSAIELTKQLQAGNLSEKETAVIKQRLLELTGSSSRTILQLTNQQINLEREAAEKKRESLLFEQEQARLSLQLQQRQADLALQRQVIEARIAEIKAKQAIIDAQSNLQQERINGQKAIGAAQSELDVAKKQAPGRERDQAVAGAQAKLDGARQEATNSQALATQSITLATQQAQLTAENTKQILAQQTQQTEINRLQTATLAIQQDTALKQAEIADEAQRYANNLAKARAEAEGIKAAQAGNGQAATQLPGRATGGNVTGGQAYVVGEKEAEVFVPNTSGTILNRSQILGNLSTLAGAVNFQLPQAAAGGDNKAVVNQLKTLQSAIESRQVPVAPQVTFASADSAEYDNYLKAQRASLRGNI
jgi:hypothetical protein